MGAHGKIERTGRTFAIPVLKSKNFFSDCNVTLEKTVPSRIPVSHLSFGEDASLFRTSGN